MPSLLPGSIADERFQRLERVAAARFAGIDQTRLLVMLIDHVDASALPALGWQLGTIDEAWNLADEAGKRALLKSTVARRRKRGTPWAVRDALSALGHDSVIRENVQIRHDGNARHDGTFDYSDRARFAFWVVVKGTEHSRVELRSVVDRWKRRSTRGEVYFVAYLEDALETFAYRPAPHEHTRKFDRTFGLTFE